MLRLPRPTCMFQNQKSTLELPHKQPSLGFFRGPDTSVPSSSNTLQVSRPLSPSDPSISHHKRQQTSPSVHHKNPAKTVEKEKGGERVFLLSLVKRTHKTIKKKKKTPAQVGALLPLRLSPPLARTPCIPFMMKGFFQTERKKFSTLWFQIFPPRKSGRDG